MGAEALNVLSEHRVDLILCDINMPVMDRLEFIKRLPAVANDKNVPVVMITTEGSEAHVVQALPAPLEVISANPLLRTGQGARHSRFWERGIKTSSVMPATESHEQWVPLLEVASREVFE